MLPLDLTWDAPPECPSYADVVTELERITRVKPGREITSVRAKAKIERLEDGRYRLMLLTEREGQTGETDLDAASCPVLKRGVTLVLALTLGDGVDVVDQDISDAKPAPSDGADSKPTPKPPSPPTVPVAPSAPSADAAVDRFRWSPWLAGNGGWGLLREPSFGAQLGLAMGRRHWQTRLDATFWPPVAGARFQGVDSSYFAFVGAVGACGRWPFAGWSFAGCATLQIGAIHGAATGAFRDGAATAPWYAAAPSVVVTAPFYGPVALRVEAAVAIAFDPPHFAIQHAQDVYAVARFVPALSLGLVW